MNRFSTGRVAVFVGICVFLSVVAWIGLQRSERRAVSQPDVDPHSPHQVHMGGTVLLRLGDPVRPDKVRLHVAPFQIDTDPVTVGEYAVFTAQMGTQRGFYPFLSGGDLVPAPDADQPQLPAVIGAPDQATAYCAWRGGRLPTESEWLLSACGVDHRAYPSGDTLPDGLANMNGVGLAPTGEFPRDVGVGGIRGVAGNAIDLVAADVVRDGVHYVLRGGAWDLTEIASRCDTRIPLEPTYAAFVSMQVGFRCVVPASP